MMHQHTMFGYKSFTFSRSERYLAKFRHMDTAIPQFHWGWGGGGTYFSATCVCELVHSLLALCACDPACVSDLVCLCFCQALYENIC